MLSLGLTVYLCHLVGFLYPCYASFKALETKDPSDDIQWLTYWVVYSMMSTTDALVGDILGWIPLFYEAKLLFIIWMLAPQFKGAKVLYDKIVKPLLLKYAAKLDPVFNTAQSVIESPAMGMALNLAQQYGPDVAEQAMKIAREKAAEVAAAQANNTEGEKEK
ncbi:hypothetical protein BSKO_02015 [Bryopsis sp. KO-2023]|nr:hypothetical protein BSKO_02015 [Bryopsis sp. KO-2023]